MHSSLSHEFQELLFVFRPNDLLALVSVQHLLRGRQFRQMDIFHSANGLQKETQIVALGKTCQLRGIIQSDIDDALGS